MIKTGAVSNDFGDREIIFPIKKICYFEQASGLHFRLSVDPGELFPGLVFLLVKVSHVLPGVAGVLRGLDSAILVKVAVPGPRLGLPLIALVASSEEGASSGSARQEK